VYRGAHVTAVDHLCLGIPRGECFGLLGINGEYIDSFALLVLGFCCSWARGLRGCPWGISTRIHTISHNSETYANVCDVRSTQLKIILSVIITCQCWYQPNVSSTLSNVYHVRFHSFISGTFILFVLNYGWIWWGLRLWKWELNTSGLLKINVFPEEIKRDDSEVVCF